MPDEPHQGGEPIQPQIDRLAGLVNRYGRRVRKLYRACKSLRRMAQARAREAEQMELASSGMSRNVKELSETIRGNGRGSWPDRLNNLENTADNLEERQKEDRRNFEEFARWVTRSLITLLFAVVAALAGHVLWFLGAHKP